MPIAPSNPPVSSRPRPGAGRDLLIGVGIVPAATASAAELAFDPDYMTDAAMLCLLGVVVASLRLGAVLDAGADDYLTTTSREGCSRRRVR